LGDPNGWTTNENGELLTGGYHDSLITEFAYSASGSLHMTMWNPQEEHGLAIELKSIRELGVHGLLHTIIVSDVFIWKVSAASGYVPDQAWRMLYKDHLWTCERPSVEHVKEAAARFAAKAPDAFLFWVTTACGADIVADCDQITMRALSRADHGEP
jgi:hypothetical protein